MQRSKRLFLIFLSISVLVLAQLACEAADRFACFMTGGEWLYIDPVTKKHLGPDVQRCDHSVPAPEPPLWSEPEQPAPEEAPPSVPEVEETLEPEECNQRAAVDIGMGPNDNTICDCAYFVHFTSYEETILYYRTQTYVDPADPRQRWQVQRLFAGEAWTWSSETIEDGVCVPAVIDEYTIFIAVEGCDNMYKRASWAIDEYARSLESLCP